MPLKQTGIDNVVPSVPVYDAATVRQTLARAAEIEAQSKDAPLSAVQIEALGKELGLSLEAVRQSLGEVIGTQHHIQQQSHQREPLSMVGTLPTSYVTREIAKAVVPGLLYGFAMFVFFALVGAQFMRPNVDPSLLTLSFLCSTLIPSLLIFIVGWQRRDYRLGALAGLVLSVANAIGFTFGMMVAATEEAGRVNQSLGIESVLYIGVAILLGALGGMCGQAVQTLVARNRTNNR